MLRSYEAKIGAVVVVCVLLLSGMIGGCAYGLPKYNLYRAETQKRVKIADARAEADAAEYRAESEVARAEREAERDRVRAQGTADANAIIGESITPEYLQWLFIENLTQADGTEKVIYIPVGGDGMPLLPTTEAGRATTPTTNQGANE